MYVSIFILLYLFLYIPASTSKVNVITSTVLLAMPSGNEKCYKSHLFLQKPSSFSQRKYIQAACVITWGNIVVFMKKASLCLLAQWHISPALLVTCTLQFLVPQAILVIWFHCVKLWTLALTSPNEFTLHEFIPFIAGKTHYVSLQKLLQVKLD